MVQPFKFRNGKVISPHSLPGMNYLSMLGLKLNHASTRGPIQPTREMSTNQGALKLIPLLENSSSKDMVYAILIEYTYIEFMDVGLRRQSLLTHAMILT